MSTAYSVDGYEGMAWRKLGRVSKRGNVSMYMVGDDTVRVFPASKVHKLKRGTYCPSCGQMGCMACR